MRNQKGRREIKEGKKKKKVVHLLKGNLREKEKKAISIEGLHLFFFLFFKEIFWKDIGIKAR